MTSPNPTASVALRRKIIITTQKPSTARRSRKPQGRRPKPTPLHSSQQNLRRLEGSFGTMVRRVKVCIRIRS
jgi:hypothetical protein